MLLDPEANICKALFDTLPKDAEKTLGMFEALVRTLSDAADPDAIVVTERAMFDFIANHVREGEKQFERDIWDTFVKGLYPNISGWSELAANPGALKVLKELSEMPEVRRKFAEVHVLKAMDHLGLQLSADEIESRAAWLENHLTVPFALYHLVIQRVVGQGARLNRPERRNWWWDMSILFGIGDDQGVEGLPLTLVSSDGDMADAARRAGFGKHVVRYPDYLEQLGLDSSI